MIKLRTATLQDAAFVKELYDYYILNTVHTFNEEPKPLEHYIAEIQSTLPKYPFIIAEIDNKPVGFACAEPFRMQSGYRYSAECTIYLSQTAPKRQGIGKLLYTSLCKELTKRGYVNAIGVVSGENLPSIKMHKGLGFEIIATFKNSAYKLGRWLDTIIMVKELNKPTVPPVQPFN